MTEPPREIPLTREEVDQILAHCGADALLVGGQALAFWAARYEVERVGALAEKITSDADFVGGADVAARLGKALKWRYWEPSFDDATSQTAKLTQEVPGFGYKQIDFLNGIVGLERSKIEQRAVKVTLPGGASIRLLHPLDVLESRLKNLLSLPSKRNEAGVAQAKLAIAVAARYLDAMIDEAGAARVFDAVERVAQIALDKRLTQVYAEYGLEPLGCVPVSRIPGPQFQTKRWPQIVAADLEQRRRHAKRLRAKRTPR